MHQPHRLLLGVDHEQAGDLQRIELLQRLGRQRIGLDGLGRLGHHGSCRALQQVGRHVAAQVAVGDDADQPSIAVEHAKAAVAPPRHDDQHVGHGHGLEAKRQFFLRMHDVAHMLQLRSQLAAGVELAEVMRAEALVLEQRNGQRIAQGELQQRRCRGREAIGAGLLGAWQRQHDVGFLAQRRIRHRGDGDQRHGEALGIGENVTQLGRLAGIGDHDHRIVRRDHAQVAVAGFRRVHEARRRSGGGERRRDLAGDVARLSHAGHHHAALGLADDFDGLRQRITQGPVKGGDQLLHAFGFGDERPAGGFAPRGPERDGIEVPVRHGRGSRPFGRAVQKLAAAHLTPSSRRKPGPSFPRVPAPSFPRVPAPKAGPRLSPG